MLLASGATGAGEDIWSGGKGLWGQILWQLCQRGAGTPCIPHPVARHCSHASPDPLGRDEGAGCQGGGLDTRLMPARGDAGASQACPRHGLCSQPC